MLRLIILFFIVSNILSAEILKGTVSYAGKKKPRKELTDIVRDPVCGSFHETPPLNEYPFILDENNNLKNVLVYLKMIGESDDSWPVSNDPVVLTQKGCMYSPHVFGIQTNQTLLIKNNDKTGHNVAMAPKINETSNNMQPQGAPDIKHSFPIAEQIPFKIKCDVHPWMITWGLVSDHPYFAVTDDNGNYEINNIPEGDYEVVFWQELLSNMSKRKYIQVSHTQTISITENEEGFTVSNYQFPKPERKPKKE